MLVLKNKNTSKLIAAASGKVQCDLSIDNVKLVNCQLINSDLCFEYCTNIDAEITSVIDSIKNPYSGRIHAFGIKEIILDEQYIDKKKTTIIIDNKHE